MEPHEQWIERAEYDLATAQAMLEARRYLYVLFCCQQAIEKALKALVALRTEECPPRTHSLLELAAIANLRLAPPQQGLFRELCSYYITSRYPEGMAVVGPEIDAERAARVLSATEEVIQWLLSTL
jgi:HEPN domain-containing protein